MGGTRDVPVPDPIARDYLLLGFRLDQQLPGTVDGYFGPADLKAQVDLEQLRPAARLADDAAALRDRLPGEVEAAERRHWLALQLDALEMLARVQAGEPVGYLEQVVRSLGCEPVRRRPESFEEAAARLDALLPGPDPLETRLAREDEAWTVPADRVLAVMEVLVPWLRARAGERFGLPAGEDVRIGLVRGQPWTGYNWYDGGYRSRVDLNLDRPLNLPGLVGTAAHETYPGHHLEHALKEQVLVEEQGRLEASMLLINAPECLVSEGIANVGRELVLDAAELESLLVELAPVAGVPLAADAGALREAAARHRTLAAQRAVLGETRINAALMLHEDGRSREEAIAYLVEVGRLGPDAAGKRLEFLEHPLWRTYVFAYPEGEALVRRWVEAGPPRDRAARFGRLLREQLTPASLAADLAAG